MARRRLHRLSIWRRSTLPFFFFHIRAEDALVDSAQSTAGFISAGKIVPA